MIRDENEVADGDPQDEGNSMFIAMNRFKIVKGEETAFEAIWASRRTRLDEMEGFVAFHLLRGPEREDHTLYASHTMWRSKESFLAWTTSEQFRDAHKDAGKNKPLYLGHPEFEGFDSVLEQATPAVAAVAE
jgi:heme-degrading monooxygenase HmoA